MLGKMPKKMLAKSCHFSRQTTPNDAKEVPAFEMMKIFLLNFSMLTDINWRRGRDSNPRYAFGVHTLSRRAPSTARTPLP